MYMFSCNDCICNDTLYNLSQKKFQIKRACIFWLTLKKEPWCAHSIQHPLNRKFRFIQVKIEIVNGLFLYSFKYRFVIRKKNFLWSCSLYFWIILCTRLTCYNTCTRLYVYVKQNRCTCNHKNFYFSCESSYMLFNFASSFSLEPCFTRHQSYGT